MSKLTWQTKIAHTDYELVKLPFGYRVQDNRNRRSYLIPIDTLRAIVAIPRSSLTPSQVIDYCINAAVIPHPYDELL